MSLKRIVKDKELASSNVAQYFGVSWYDGENKREYWYCARNIEP